MQWNRGYIYHCLSQCEVVVECFKELKQIIEVVLDRKVTDIEIICYGYNHRNKKKLSLATWIGTKALYSIYMERNLNKKELQMWIDLVKEIEWNLKMQYKIGSAMELIKIRRLGLFWLFWQYRRIFRNKIEFR